MQLPIPSNWQDFETIARDALAQTWSSPNLQKNGRSGQAQHGVDIYGSDSLGRRVGVQCKRLGKALTFREVETEIKNAEKFVGILTTLYLATTSDFDARLQQRVRVLSEARVAAGKFSVGIIFWDDIVAGLLLNPAVFQLHYPHLQIPHLSTVDRDRRLAAIELGFYGADLWEYTKLVFGECGWLAGADADEYFANLRVIEHRANQLFSPQDASTITAPLSEIQDELRKPSDARFNWELIEGLAKRVSKRCLFCSSLLPVEESNALDIAAKLGRVYHHSDDLPAKATRDDIKRKVAHLLTVSSMPEIDRVFLEASRIKSGYRWVMRIYGLLDREIRYG